MYCQPFKSCMQGKLDLKMMTPETNMAKLMGTLTELHRIKEHAVWEELMCY